MGRSLHEREGGEWGQRVERAAGVEGGRGRRKVEVCAHREQNANLNKGGGERGGDGVSSENNVGVGGGEWRTRGRGESEGVAESEEEAAVGKAEENASREAGGKREWSKNDDK